MGDFDLADADILADGHFVAHEILEDDAHLAMQIVERVFAQVDAVEKDLTFGGIVEARDELDDGGFALTVFADECDALAGLDGEVEVFEDAAVGAGIGEGNVAELEAATDRSGRGQGVGFRLHGRLASRRSAIRSVRKSA